MKSSTIRPFIVVAWVGSGLGKVKSNIRYFDLKVSGCWNLFLDNVSF